MDLKCTHGSSRFGRRRRRKPVFQPSGISTTQRTDGRAGAADDGDEPLPFSTKCINKSKARCVTRTGSGVGRAGYQIKPAKKTKLCVR